MIFHIFIQKPLRTFADRNQKEKDISRGRQDLYMSAISFLCQKCKQMI